MTKEQKIEEIRKDCIVANPEIVELKSGCEVKFQGKIGRIWTIRNNIIQCEEFGNLKQEELDKCGILGRPIRLADVLFTIRMNWARDRKTKLVSIDNRSQELCSLWNLLKDNLSDQSEETINFIYELLS